jgi:DNA-binding NarL/FixJ family response regulator
MQKIKVVIIEDDHDWLNAMLAFLHTHDDIEIVGTAYTQEDSLELVRASDIDVLIMDISLNGVMDAGIYTVLEILKIKQVKIIMLTGLRDEKTIKDAFTAGAIDYIIKDNFYDLPYAIRRIYNRSAPAEILLKEFQRLKREEQIKELTPSEKELYQYIEKGYTLTQMESLIFKAKNTIKHQVRSILHKLDVKSRKEAVDKVNAGGLKRTDRDLRN